MGQGEASGGLVARGLPATAAERREWGDRARACNRRNRKGAESGVGVGGGGAEGGREKGRRERKAVEEGGGVGGG